MFQLRSDLFTHIYSILQLGRNFVSYSVNDYHKIINNDSVSGEENYAQSNNKELVNSGSTNEVIKKVYMLNQTFYLPHTIYKF